MSEQPAGERTEEPTQKRKTDARNKGTVAKSTELTGAVTLVAASMAIPPVLGKVAESAIGSFYNQVSKAPSDVTEFSIMGFTQGVAGPWITGTITLMCILTTVGVLTNFAQVGFHLSTEPMQPKFEKINPGAGLKRMFSRRALMEGLKATAKMIIFGFIAYSAISADWGKLLGLSQVAPAQAAAAVSQILHGLLVKVSIFWLVIAAIDYVFQKKEVDKQLKMTKQELKQEMKEQEGSPEVKSAQYQKRREMMKGGLAKQLKEADVLITNPTHFAIAIKYQRNSMHAPIVLAKGQDFLALKMREFARDLELPIVENKPLARALYAQCEAGDFVPRDLFGPVAEVLAYVYKTVKTRRNSA
jgi:flagellar biosynthetic protein FlhB